MKDNRSKKVKSICDANIARGCRECCPLAKPCIMQAGDSYEFFHARMNKAAEAIENRGGDI